MVTGLSHLTFIVKDLERTTRLLEAVFDAKVVYSSGDETFSLARERFLMVGDVWVALMEGDRLTEHTYDHVAFRIPEEEFDSYDSRVRSAGVDTGPQRPRVEGEGRSIYFYDFDGHLFELHTGTLAGRLARYTNCPETEA